MVVSVANVLKVPLQFGVSLLLLSCGTTIKHPLRRTLVQLVRYAALLCGTCSSAVLCCRLWRLMSQRIIYTTGFATNIPA
jgi:hypothetical protein